MDFTSASMENDVSQWLTNPATNLGWIIVSDESVTGTNASSKRDFASRQHANAAFQPLLSFDVLQSSSHRRLPWHDGIRAASLLNRYRK